MQLRRTPTVAALFPPTIRQWLGPLLAAGAVAGVLAILVIAAGWPDLAASTPHPDGWARVLHATFLRSTAHHAAGIEPPADLDAPPHVIKGAIYYDRVCANCHGAPGRGQSPIAMAMRPQPQYLVNQARVFSAAELFWIVQHGVKYSGMPAWPTQDRGDEVWSIVAFLRQLPKLDNARYTALAGNADLQRGGGVTAPAAPSGSYQPTVAMAPLLKGVAAEYSLARPSVAFGRGAIGDNAAASCDQCHSADGAGRPGSPFPNLTLLNATALREALHGYADGSRHSGYMQPVAAQLGDAQIEALAGYFAALPRRPSPQFAAAPELLAQGRAIAQAGVPGAPTSACRNCHDINRANARLYPAIAGQNVWYLRDQLRLFREGVRGSGPKNPMGAAARQLNDTQIAAVAAWYAALPPEAPAPVAEAR